MKNKKFRHPFLWMVEPDDTNTPGAGVVTQTDPDAALGDAGKKALQAERDARKQAEKQAADLRSELDRAKSELDAEKGLVLRYKTAAEHGISVEDADLFLIASDENTLKSAAERLAARSKSEDSPPAPRPDLTQGGNGVAAAPTTGEQFAQFLESKLPE